LSVRDELFKNVTAAIDAMRYAAFFINKQKGGEILKFKTNF